MTHNEALADCLTLDTNGATPIYLHTPESLATFRNDAPPHIKAWLDAHSAFSAKAGSCLTLPALEGGIEGVVA